MPNALQSNRAFAKLKSFKTRPKVLSLTGCFVEQIGSLMASHCDVDHLWRVSIPMIAASSFGGRNFYHSEVAGVAERLNYELSRAYFEKITSTNYDIVLLDVVSEFSNDYFEKDGTIISDITCGLLGENWTWPDGFDISSWNRIRPTDPNYAELYVRSLASVINQKIFGDAKLILVKRNLCRSAFVAAGIHVIDDAQIEFQSACIESIQNMAADMPNVDVIELNHSRIFTDEWAPSGGGKFHPSEEYYVLMIDRVCDHFSIGPDFRAQLVQSAIGRIKQRRHAERDELRARVHALTVERDDLAARIDNANAIYAERDSFISSVAGLSAERDSLLSRIETLTAERDSLSLQVRASDARLEDLTAQVGDARVVHAEHSGFDDRLNALAQERDALAAEVQSLVAERDDLRAKAGSTAAVNDEVTIRLSSVVSERDGFAGRLNAAMAERDALAAQIQSLATDRDALAVEARSLAVEREGLAAQLSMANAERDRLAARLQASSMEKVNAGELARLGQRLETLFALTDQGRLESLSRMEAMIGASRHDLAPLERALHQAVERAGSAGAPVPALQRQLELARADAARLAADRDTLVMKLRFDDGPRALKAVLPLARGIRRTVNLFRPRAAR